MGLSNGVGKKRKEEGTREDGTITPTMFDKSDVGGKKGWRKNNE